MRRVRRRSGGPNRLSLVLSLLGALVVASAFLIAAGDASPPRRAAAADTAPARSAAAGGVHAPRLHATAIIAKRLPFTLSKSKSKARVEHESTTTYTATPCSSLTAAQTEDGVGYTANQIAGAYGYSNLYMAGDTGSGQTIAVLEFEPNLKSDIADFQDCYGTDTTVNYEQIDGGAGDADGGAGGGEAALDIEQLIATAPGATIDVYQAPNTSAGMLAALKAMVANSAITVISSSWDTCESEAEAADSSILSEENTLFEKAAADGVSVLAASGDSGSSGCDSDALTVDDPASQPYVTAVGGTSLPSSGGSSPTPNSPGSQSVWNDQYGASGGGISSVWGMPSWQQGAASTVAKAAVSAGATACSSAASGGECRAVPDVSADADPATGYWIVYDGRAVLIGGTSAAAPLWAGMVALANASAACDGHNLGFLNQLLYEVADTTPTAFTDITSGNNDYVESGENDGEYQAGAGYDLATGLGTPNAASLIPALCTAAVNAPAITVTTPTATTTTTSTSTTSTSTSTTKTTTTKATTTPPKDGKLERVTHHVGAQKFTVTVRENSKGMVTIRYTDTIKRGSGLHLKLAQLSYRAGGRSHTLNRRQRGSASFAVAMPAATTKLRLAFTTAGRHGRKLHVTVALQQAFTRTHASLG